MSYELSPVVSSDRNIIRVGHPNIDGMPSTTLGSDASAGAVTLTVLDNAGFANADLYLAETYGLEKAEIKKINGAVTAGTSLTTTALTFKHSVDAPITFMLWDQVVIYGNNTNSTSAGSPTILSTSDLAVDQPFTQYVNTGTTYTYYFARYKNSVTTTYSSYSDIVGATGIAVNSRGKIKQRALDAIDEKKDEVITEDFLNDQIRNCEQDIMRRNKYWSWLKTDNIDSPTAIVQGKMKYTLPTTIADANSPKSILTVSIRNGRPLSLVTLPEWRELTLADRFTTLTADVALVDVTISVATSGDLDAGSVTTPGTITIGNDEITYTSKTSTLLSGVTGITATHTSGDEVHQNISFSEPLYYTVKEGKMYLWPVPSSTEHGYNMYQEYFKTLTTMDSDGDETEVPFDEAFDYWLMWKIAVRRKNPDDALMYKKMYDELVLRALANETPVTPISFAARVPQLRSIDLDKSRLSLIRN